MHLSESEAKQFFKLWLGLIFYVNQIHKINTKLKPTSSPAGLELKKLAPIREKLYEDINIIDEYIDVYRNTLTDDEKEILKSWKTFIRTDFIVVKHLKNYSVFMSNEGAASRVYGVIGITNGLDEIIPNHALPALIETVLLPYKNQIIYDGIIMSNRIKFGSGYTESINNTYRAGKEKYGIITDLLNQKNVVVTNEPKPKRKPSANAERKRRIDNEILVDTYDEYEEMSAWHCYLEDNLSFPFNAVCDENTEIFPLIKGDAVRVMKMADIEYCYGGMFVMVEWSKRTFAFPLEYLTTDNTDKKTVEAIGDWKYWANKHSGK